MEAAAQFVVESPDVVYGPEAIEAQYEYRTTSVSREDGILKVGKGPGGRELGDLENREGVGLSNVCGPGLIAPPRPSPGAPLVHAFHLPDRPAGAPTRGHARWLGWQQWLHAHRCRAGKPAAPVLAHPNRSQGGGVRWGAAEAKASQRSVHEGLCSERMGPLGGVSTGTRTLRVLRGRSLRYWRALERDLWRGAASAQARSGAKAPKMGRGPWTLPHHAHPHRHSSPAAPRRPTTMAR